MKRGEIEIERKKAEKILIFWDFVFDLFDYIKYFVLYGKGKGKNGQTTAKGKRQKNQDSNSEAKTF